MLFDGAVAVASLIGTNSFFRQRKKKGRQIRPFLVYHLLFVFFMFWFD
jgi:hypothetical protein